MHLLIIEPHNFPNLFDKVLIGRPRFRLKFLGLAEYARSVASR